MQVTREPPLKYTLEASNHPYLSGAWKPVHEEVSVDELEVIEGVIPADIDGIYYRGYRGSGATIQDKITSPSEQRPASSSRSSSKPVTTPAKSESATRPTVASASSFS